MSKNPNMSKAERREAARAEALALRQKEQQRDRRNRIITLSVLAVALVALGVVVWMILQQGAKKNVDDIALADATLPATAQDNGGIPVGKDGAAGTDNGDAPVIDVYLDYMCPICGQFEQTNADSIDEMVGAGDATVVYHPISILDAQSQGSEYSTRSASAAAYVADKAPDAFPAFHAALFTNQPKEGTQGLTDEQLASYAKDAGVPDDVSSAISDGTARETFGQYVFSATKEIQKDDGFTGTPYVLVDGKVVSNWNDPSALKQAVTAANSAG
ncbi:MULTISPECIES: DsbA family protein [unclassified Isoptericola]|uniref:DsbA family protein n=1 Tax=Isoptericola sp. NPDC057191 TaxID=3346041 RepID=UPI003631B9D0